VYSEPFSRVVIGRDRLRFLLFFKGFHEEARYRAQLETTAHDRKIGQAQGAIEQRQEPIKGGNWSIRRRLSRIRLIYYDSSNTCLSAISFLSRLVYAESMPNQFCKSSSFDNDSS
jgi:hypothetical protein